MFSKDSVGRWFFERDSAQKGWRNGVKTIYMEDDNKIRF
jgi:hypothetical protein